MATITEAYCSPEVTKLLKEKGFDYQGFDYIDFEGEIIRQDRPTLQTAMKWLREKHIVIVIHPEYFNCETVSYWGVDVWADDNYENLSGDYPKYEEACEAAIKYCLENLI